MGLAKPEESIPISPISRLEELERSVHELADTQFKVYEIVIKRLTHLTYQVCKLELRCAAITKDRGGGPTHSLETLQELLNVDSPDS